MASHGDMSKLLDAIQAAQERGDTDTANNLLAIWATVQAADAKADKEAKKAAEKRALEPKRKAPPQKPAPKNQKRGK